MPTIEASTLVQADAEAVFDLLVNTQNIPEIVPPDLKLSVLQAPPVLAAGSRFEVQILGYGPPQRVTYEITDFDRPGRFVETQVKGALKRYVHEHLLESQGPGSTRVTDRITFEP